MSTEAMGAPRRIHPLVAVAAVSVTALSLTGIAAMTGLIGGSKAEPSPVAAQVAPLSAESATAALPQAMQPTQPMQATQPQQAQAAGGHTAPSVAKAPVKVSRPAPVASTPAATQPAEAPVQRAAIDPNVGTVLAINRIDVSPSNNGVGAVAGGVLGGIAGHQVGGGRGKDVATVLGAVGGAIAGNAVESHQRKTYRYDVQVRSDDGSTRVLHYSAPPTFNVGDRISLKTAQG